MLNRSQPKQWRPSPARAVLHHFGGWRDFNPMVIVSCPFGRTHVFRHVKAFGEYPHGNAEPVRRLTICRG